MIRVIFVCLGNICRSPMGELILKHMIEERGLTSSIEVSSCGTSDYEVGNPVYPPAQKTLKEHGISGSHRSRQLTKADVINSDYILVMDSSNLVDVLRLTGGQYGEKIFKLCSFTSNPRDVADPWYTRDFETAFNDIYDGCNCFLNYLMEKHKDAFNYDKYIP